MLTLALILTLLTAPQAAPSSVEQAAADARTAAEAAEASVGVASTGEALEAEARAALCAEAKAAKAHIIAAAVRLGERDPDLMRAWAAADRIERLAC